MTSYAGRCHCGAIGFTFTTALAPSRWSVRACQCAFCRAHAALSASDPAGAVRFEAARPESLVRYRFGLRTADFLLCRECGVYIGAVMARGEQRFGIVNVNALAPIPADLAAPSAMTYDGETAEGRGRRREERWSPATDALAAAPRLERP
jgi:hypothetical protein